MRKPSRFRDREEEISPMTTADWYFDIISPFAYLQSHSFDQLPGDLAIRPKPVLLGAILSHWGQIGPAEIPAKRRHTYRMCVWTARQRNIPFRMPPRHPFNPLAGLRVLAGADVDAEMARKALAFVFEQGRAPDTDEELAAFGEAIGLEGEAAALAGAQASKDALRANTEEAIARGAFGVPTFHLDGENFWGDDATELFAAYLADRSLFAAPEWMAIDAVEVGVTRKQARG
jgi:2-hydroxychromene-2-carboxylate isomerase